MDIEQKTLELLSKNKRYNQCLYQNIRHYLGNRILEIGCGIGSMTVFFLSKDFVLSVDNNKSHIQRMKDIFKKNENVKPVVMDITRSMDSIKKYNFDTIVCINVLHHIKDDNKVLKNMYDVLSKNGRVILIEPALRMLYNRLDIHQNHVRRYSRKELDKNIMKKGFKIEKSRYLNLLGALGWFYQGNIRRKKILDSTKLGIFDKTIPIFNSIERIIKPPVGLSLLYICKKIES